MKYSTNVKEQNGNKDHHQHCNQILLSKSAQILIFLSAVTLSEKFNIPALSYISRYQTLLILPEFDY